MMFEKAEDYKERHRLLFGERGEEVDEEAIYKDTVAFNETIPNIDSMSEGT